jgi:hypothetical protein
MNDHKLIPTAPSLRGYSHERGSRGGIPIANSNPCPRLLTAIPTMLLKLEALRKVAILLVF